MMGTELSEEILRQGNVRASSPFIRTWKAQHTGVLMLSSCALFATQSTQSENWSEQAHILLTYLLVLGRRKYPKNPTDMWCTRATPQAYS